MIVICDPLPPKPTISCRTLFDMQAFLCHKSIEDKGIFKRRTDFSWVKLWANMIKKVIHHFRNSAFSMFKTIFMADFIGLGHKYIPIVNNKDNNTIFVSLCSKIVSLPVYIVIHCSKEKYLNYEIHKKMRFKFIENESFSQQFHYIHFTMFISWDRHCFNMLYCGWNQHIEIPSNLELRVHNEIWKTPEGEGFRLWHKNKYPSK